MNGSWTDSLQEDLEKMAAALESSIHPWQEREGVWRPEQFGAEPGKKATEAIQKAIDAAALHGGTVKLSRGDYLSGTLVMRSNVRLQICAGARLLASTDLADYPEKHAKRLTVQDTSMGMHQSLIFAEGCRNICLCGDGVIDGRGTPDHFPGEETAQGTPGRPFLIRILDCSDVEVSGVTLKNAACWMQNYLNCERLLLTHLTVRNHANYNNDGMDIDGCRDVIIRHCRVSSGDDALCFKGASQRNTERILVEDCDFYSACNAIKVGTDTQGSFRNILVRHCRIGGLAEDPSGLKHPCSDSGVSLETVDGGTVERIWLDDLHIRRAMSPLFFRIADRGRVKPGDPKPGIGQLHRVLVTHVRGTGNGIRGSYMMGMKEHPIQEITFRDVLLEQYAMDDTPVDASCFGDYPDAYPDAHMIDDTGPAPAYALWTRYAEGIRLEDYRVLPDGEEKRPAVLQEN